MSHPGISVSSGHSGSSSATDGLLFFISLASQSMSHSQPFSLGFAFIEEKETDGLTFANGIPPSDSALPFRRLGPGFSFKVEVEVEIAESFELEAVEL